MISQRRQDIAVMGQVIQLNGGHLAIRMENKGLLNQFFDRFAEQ